MTFTIDKQTFADLEIFEGRKGRKSILQLFDRVVSHGGKQELLSIFCHPLSDLKTINERQELIRYFHQRKSSFTIDRYLLDFIEHYLLMGNKPTRVSRFNAWHKNLKYFIQPTNEYFIIQRGIIYTIEFLQELNVFIGDFGQSHPPVVERYFKLIADHIRTSELNQIIGFNTKKKLKPIDIERFDYIFRFSQYESLKNILQIVYQIDVFQSVADVANELHLVFPEISDQQEIKIDGLFHPFLKDAVTNDIWLDENSNIFFVTGANMAGKSTFLKALGVAVYLTHLGFPVAATSMKSGVFNGLFSTINLSDDLNQGYSHFYNEVLRVKDVAREINRLGNLVIIFDELFRGTNVKDAYDASLSIISAFAKVRSCMFLVSTHIIEVADNLSSIKNIRFGYFHTTIDEKTPVYSYQLKEGLTDERLGMLIIENEKIVEIIESGTTK